MDNRIALKENYLKDDRKQEFEGLTEDEVKASRAKYGENRLSKQKRKGIFLSFLESFGDPMIKILLIALAINVIFLFHEADWFESIGIAVAILIATVVSTLSEYGSESAFEKIQEEASKISCRVQRAQGIRQIPMEEIVVGDLIVLQSGDRIPADGIMVLGGLDVDQSSINGESKEAKKFPQLFEHKEEAKKSDFLNPALLFSGTVVCSGEGLMRVTQIGDETFYGKIGAELQEETRESPLKLRLRTLAGSIGKLGYAAAAFSAIAYLFNHIVIDNNFNMNLILSMVTSLKRMFPIILQAATLAVTVIVMAVPEGLPMMITVVLSSNMKRMLKDQVLVRKLVGIETAGSLNILFTDKTGTLTGGKLTVTHFISGSLKTYEKEEFYQNKMTLWNIVRDSVIHNCSSYLSEKTVVGGNATDRALLEFAILEEGQRRNIKKQNVIPFSSDLKFMATTLTGDWKTTLIKGAPEKILPFCNKYYDESGNVRPFNNRIKAEKLLKEMTKKAVRIIAIATAEKPVDVSEVKRKGFSNLTLVGLVGIRDDIRPEAIEGIKQVQSAGIQAVMITGDSRETAYAIAKESGLIKSEHDLVITSDELSAMSDNVLSEKLRDLRVVSRALPSDKSRLVRVAQAKGLVVGMTGDGVNDAPALKQADVGFSMGSGTEVAKEAGDVVILDDNFLSIAKAVCYGRTIFKSIRKFIIYQLSICMCAVGVTVIGPLVGVDFPITVIQMLWINIVMDTLAGLAFSGEKARLKYMQEPPKSRDEPIMNAYMLNQITVNSIYATLLCLFFLKNDTIARIFSTHSEVYKMTAFFGLFMFSAIFSSFCARTHEVNLFDYLSANKPFIWIMSVVTAVQVGILYFGGSVFRTVKLELKDLILVIVLAVTVIPIDLLRKHWLSRHSDLQGT